MQNKTCCGESSAVAVKIVESTSTSNKVKIKFWAEVIAIRHVWIVSRKRTEIVKYFEGAEHSVLNGYRLKKRAQTWTRLSFWARKVWRLFFLLYRVYSFTSMWSAQLETHWGVGGVSPLLNTMVRPLIHSSPMALVVKQLSVKWLL